MKRSKVQIIDQLGIITSGLCAIHCVALPLLLSFGLLSGLTGMLHDTAETTIIVFSGILGIWSIYNGWQGHGKLHPQVLIGSGALLIVIGFFFTFLGHGLMALGGCILFAGHWLNWREWSITD